MPDLNLDIIAIGNAIVDVINQTDEEFLLKHGLTKGTMSLINSEQIEKLSNLLPQGIERSGGSAANTAVGISSLGGKAAFIGKVKKDRLGEIFCDDLESNNVIFQAPITHEGPPTANSLILVTPDAERTMNTFLGACVELGPDYIDPAIIREAEITYLEGYLWDRKEAKAAFVKAAKLAKSASKKVAFTLSDVFCVERWREEFLDLIKEYVDILFANEAEILSLFKTEDFNDATNKVQKYCEISALTMSERGSVIVSRNTKHQIPAEPIENVIDTTGAGDLYAAGVLYGLVKRQPLDICGKLGAVCAREAISHIGARPEISLKLLTDKELSLN